MELSHITVGMQSSTSTLESSLVVSYKVKYILKLLPSNATCKYVPKGMKAYIYPHKDVSIDNSRDLYSYCSNLEIT